MPRPRRSMRASPRRWPRAWPIRRCRRTRRPRMRRGGDRPRESRARGRRSRPSCNAPAESIVLTSGATESVNLAILGAARAAGAARRHVVTSRVEHRAGLDACRQLEREGFDVTWLRPRPDGTPRSGAGRRRAAAGHGARFADAREQRDRRADGRRRDRGAVQCARHSAARRCRAERGQGSDRCRVLRRRAAELLRAQARRAQGHRCALRAPAAAARPAAAACSAAVTRAACDRGRSRCTRSSASAPPARWRGAGLVEEAARQRALRERSGRRCRRRRRCGGTGPGRPCPGS